MWFRRLLVFGLVSLLAGQVQPSMARRALDLLLTERYAELFQSFTSEMQAGLTEQVMRQQLGPQIGSYGRVIRVGEPQVSKSGEFAVYVFPVQFASGAFEFELAVDANQRLAGLHFRPAAVAWQPPSYNRPTYYRERPVSIGTEPWRLPGTLSVPVGRGPFPCVVLVHGSGPHDRDETVFALKVFKDLAEGLASHNIAVLRYEKRTKVYGEQMKSLRDLTVAQETVEDAVRAAGVARNQPEIDPKRVFVLGHSLGGYLGPRIAKQDRGLAGLVIMAGSVQPLEDIILEQNLALAPPNMTAEEQKQLDALKQDVAAVKQLDGTKQHPAVLFGLPASYFLDLKGYNPVAVARTLNIPMLILQGERDFQVTGKDFAMWGAGLGGQKGVTLKSFPGLSHMFVMGEGAGSIEEYSKPGHVAEEVITTIAGWINTAH